jgi:hypothetical protein
MSRRTQPTQAATRVAHTASLKEAAGGASNTNAGKGERCVYIKGPNVSQHFWHFAMGEFMPIVAHISKTQPTHVVILKEEADSVCPLNSFYEELCHDGLSITVSSTKQPGKIYVEVESWDWEWTPGSKESLLAAVDYLKKWALQGSASASKNELLVQNRANASALTSYYDKHHLSEVTKRPLPKRKIYGSARRQVTNLDQVLGTLQRHFEKPDYSVRMVSDDHLTLRQQIQQYANADKLVLGHGAGMFHLLWMRPDSTIVEIIPQEKLGHANGGVQGCLRLANVRNFTLARLVCRENHSAIDIRAVERCFTQQSIYRASKYPPETQLKLSLCVLRL